MLECRKNQLIGASEVRLTTFLVQLYGIISRDKLTEEEILFALSNFLVGLTAYEIDNPFTFRVPDVLFAERIADKFGIKFKTLSYCRFLKLFFDACTRAVSNSVSLKVDFAHTLVSDFRDNINSYLAETFHVTKTEIKEALADIKTFQGREGARILVRLEPFNKEELDFEAILLTLKHIEKTCKLRTYGDPDMLTYLFRKGGASVSFLHNEQIIITHSFIPEEHLGKELTNSYCEIEVDCSNCGSFEEVSVAAAYASKLAILKYRGYLDNLVGTFAEGLDVKVMLTNIQNLSTNFVRDAEKLRATFVSKYMRLVTFCYSYDADDCLVKFGFSKPKYIRIISDLHADRADNAYYSFNFGSDFVVNCGDIADDCISAVKWIRANMTRGIIVPGNHMGYNYPYPHLNGARSAIIYESPVSPENTRTEQLRELSLKLPSQVKLLNNSVYNYEGVVFLCTTLYSNFSLYGEKHREECAGRASTGINDYVRIYKTVGDYSNRKVERYTVQDTMTNFEEALKFLKFNLNKYTKKPVVVVSHFAPLPYCVDKRYGRDALNAYFANDLSELFEKYDNLRLWCYGHVHHVTDFVYKGTRVISCPFGYGNENGFETPYKYGKRVSFADIKSRKGWTSIVQGIEVKGEEG